MKNVRISVSGLKFVLKKQWIDLGSRKRCSGILNYSTIGGIKKAISQDDTVVNRKDSLAIIEDDDPDYEGETDPFLRTEIKKYNSGKIYFEDIVQNVCKRVNSVVCFLTIKRFGS